MSTTHSPKIILITGATAGIGRATALHLAARGHHVIASGRKVAELAKLRGEATGGRLDTVELDVTDRKSIETAVAAVARLTNGAPIDVLVNNAGFGILGPTAESTDDEMRRQYDTNVFGLMSVTRAFLPQMQDRRAGRIINVSSMGGRIALPYFGVYNSTKFAVEALSDSLRYELHAFGIAVTLIEPGMIRTNFEATAASGLERFSTGRYAPAIAQYEQMSKQADRLAANPAVIAKAIARASEVRRPAARYVAPRSNAIAIIMNRVLPQRVWDWAMRKLGRLEAKVLFGGAQRAAKSSRLDRAA